MNEHKQHPAGKTGQAQPREEEAAFQAEDQPYRYNRELFYSFDKEKGFSASVDYQYDANQIIIRQSWDAAEERLNEVKQKVIEGKRSPIAYYMEKQLMEVPMLAAYMDMKKWKVRWHLTNRGFSGLNKATLQKYAEVLDIPLAELTKPPFLI
jgi:hypothetical protein